LEQDAPVACGIRIVKVDRSVVENEGKLVLFALLVDGPAARDRVGAAITLPGAHDQHALERAVGTGDGVNVEKAIAKPEEPAWLDHLHRDRGSQERSDVQSRLRLDLEEQIG